MIVSTPTQTQIMARRQTGSKKSIVLLLQVEVVHVPVRKRSRPANSMYACMCFKTVVKRCNAIFSYLSLIIDNYASLNKPARPKSIQNIVIHSGTNVTFASLNSNTVYYRVFQDLKKGPDGTTIKINRVSIVYTKSCLIYH